MKHLFPLFFNLKIKTKILLTAIPIISISSGIIFCLIFYTFQSGKGADITFGRTKIIESSKQNLKDNVNLAMEILRSNHHRTNNKALLIKDHGFWLKSIVDLAEAFLKHKMELVKQGNLSVEEARIQAYNAIRQMKYQNGTGYIWIQSVDRPYPRMLVHPINSKLEGKVLDDPHYTLSKLRKRNLYQEIVEMCLRDGEGFVEYIWPKPTVLGPGKEERKISFVRYIKEWKVIIGTGLYTSDALKLAQQRSKDIIQEMRYEKDKLGYFWINDMGEPYPKMVMHPMNIQLNDLILSDDKYQTYITSQWEYNNLFQTIVNQAKNQSEGFITYDWGNPYMENLDKKNEKVISYIKLFKPWDWVIGTNFYLKNVDQLIEERSKPLSDRIQQLLISILLVSLLIIILAVIIFWYFAKTITQPASQLVDFLKEAHNNDGTISKRLSIQFNDEVGNICQHFNELFDKLDSIRYDKEELEKELSRVTTTIHNNIINRLESIGNFIRFYLNSESRPIDRLEQAEKLVSHCSKESKNILFVLKNKSCTLDELCLELELRTELIFNLLDIHYYIELPNEQASRTIIIKPYLIQCILNIFTELVNNVIKHSKASDVLITLEYLNNNGEKSLTLKLIDNGMGFDYNKEKEKRDSYGLNIMENISKEAQGKFKLESHSGKGTSATLTLQLNE